MYRSLAVPGWGQLTNGRTRKAILFFVAEAVCIGGYLYQHARYTSGDYTGIEKNNIRTNRNTFLLYWMGAKMFGVLDAYVDAQFKDFDTSSITPPELKDEESEEPATSEDHGTEHPGD